MTNNLEHEILAIVLNYPDSIVRISSMLPIEAFFNDKNKTIYRTCVDLYKRDEPVSVGVVISILDKNLNNNFSWKEYISEIMESLTAESLGEKKANILLEKFVLSEMSGRLKRVVKKIESQEVKSSDIFSEIRDDLYDLSEKSYKLDFVHIKNILEEIHEDAELMLENDGVDSESYKTGFEDLDKIIHGFKKGQLVILAGRPGMGKTTLALNLIKNFSAKFSDKAVLVISRETTAKELSMKLLSSKTHLILKTIREGRWSSPTTKEDTENNSRILHAIQALNESEIIYDDSISTDLGTCIGNILEFQKTKEIGLIVIDYLQLLEVKGLRGGTRENEVAKISRTLKQLTLKLNCPIVALSQLARKSERREDKRPILSDLRESGAIEQDADVVMLMHSEEYEAVREDTNDKIDRIITDIIVAKNRNGPTGSLKLIFNPHISLFTKYVNNEQ